MPLFKEKCVIIDDNEVDAYTQACIFKKLDSEIDFTILKNEKEAINYFEKASPSDYPYLVIYNIWLPRYFGMDFLSYYEENIYPKIEASNVVITSNSLSKEDKKIAKGFDCVKSYIIKPLQLNHIPTILWKEKEYI